jgi:hypothetical protein
VSRRYAFHGAPSRWRRWHLLVLGAAAGAGITLAVTAARAEERSFAEEACAVVRAGGDLDPRQAVDIVVQHGGLIGAVKFRCPPVEPGRFLPPVPVTVVYPP